ncbi:MAG: DsbA family protein, partial [Gammaproteobacteria bacterium]|nr:DsbA family protein [Gammaproteobacteria bacterium]
GHDAGLLEASVSPQIKQQLREATAAAIDIGVFGVPTVRADTELFFGFDDLPWLERYLQGDDPLDEESFASWHEVRPSAWRARR